MNGAEGGSIAALVLLAIVILWWRWVGYQGHDDAFYAAAALDWVHSFPPLGTNHWSLRYPLVLPTAVVIALFGPSVAALALVNLVAYALFLAINYLAVRHWFSWGAAALVTLIGVVLPQFPVQATYANPDLLEMALAVASFWTLMLARERDRSWGLMLLCGVLAGLSFLTRETSLLLVVLYGLLFLFRPAMPRWRYLLIGLGFALVVGGQAGYFAVRTGDPLYRTRISATHDRVNRSAKQAEAEAAGRTLDSEGVLATNPVVAPLAAVFVSQKYGLLFFLAIPAYALLRVGRWLEPRQRSVVDCAGLGSLVAFLFVALNTEILYVVPRYFMVPAALATVPVAVLSTCWLEVGGVRRVVAALAALGFVTTSLGLLYLENTRPMLAEERIAEFVATPDELVHVDPETAWRLRYLLLAQGLQDHVTSNPPGPNSLVAAEDGVVRACIQAPGCALRERMMPFMPG
ncbi:MAG: glycosyltransferase family 39 protein, partial [Pseudomonadota bacterium]|nr:glycosyltransferase family 39 protein [Pseudomonadota bacterium]